MYTPEDHASMYNISVHHVTLAKHSKTQPPWNEFYYIRYFLYTEESRQIQCSWYIYTFNLIWGVYSFRTNKKWDNAEMKHY